MTSRERDVLEKMVAGVPNKVVAEDLEISERTLEKHRGSVMKKMHATSIAELIRLMVRNQLA